MKSNSHPPSPRAIRRCWLACLSLLCCTLLHAGYELPPKMQWWYEARFGLFIHLGSYSQYGHGEWAFSNEHWEKAAYQEKVSAHFHPDHFDANAIVAAAKAAGMKYIVITAKHHEGFAMWRSEVPSFTDTTGKKRYSLHDYAGFGRDVLMELKQACEVQGIRFCLYYSILDWSHSSQTITKNEPIFSTMKSVAARRNYITDMKTQLHELLARYDPAVLWFDGDWCGNPDHPTAKDWWVRADAVALERFLHAEKPNLIVNERVKRGLGLADFECPEQEVPAKRLSRPWETCATMNYAWGYDVAKENGYRSAMAILQELVQVVARDGNYLLNIGPKGDGAMTEGSIRILGEIATWMAVNGESIHGTTGSPFRQEPPWGYFTGRPGLIYAHVLRWPSSPLVIPTRDLRIRRVYLLAAKDHDLEYTKSAGGILVRLPATAPDEIDTVVAVELEATPAAGVSRP